MQGYLHYSVKFNFFILWIQIILKNLCSVNNGLYVLQKLDIALLHYCVLEEISIKHWSSPFDNSILQCSCITGYTHVDVGRGDAHHIHQCGLYIARKGTRSSQHIDCEHFLTRDTIWYLQNYGYRHQLRRYCCFVVVGLMMSLYVDVIVSCIHLEGMC